MISTIATKYKRQNGKKLGQKDNQRSGTGLSQTSPRFSLLIAVIKDIFAQIKIIFLIRRPASTLNFSLLNLGKKLKQFRRFY